MTDMGVCPYCGAHSVGVNPYYCVACGKRWPDDLLKELRGIEKKYGYKPGQGGRKPKKRSAKKRRRKK